MPPTRDRQRAAARRARLERDMAERAQAAADRRRRNTIIAASIAAVLVLGGGIALVLATTGGKKHHPTATASYSPSAMGNCVWHPIPNPSATPKPKANPHIKNVGTPPTTNNPHTGTQTMTLDTNRGTISIALNDAQSPCAAASFTYLASKHFFDKTTCHRLVTSPFQVLQCGDPSGTGSGGPSYSFDDEFLPAGQRPTYVAGDVAMANSGANTNGSQFFIVLQDVPDGSPDPTTGAVTSLLGPNYTLIGHVSDGLNLAQQVAVAGAVNAKGKAATDGKPKEPVVINTLTVGPPQS
jgi:peptidyl-prolyl cis-trans isomerase B (cyclophilin B)